MNKARRERLEKVRNELEAIADEEDEALYNMRENLQHSERGEMKNGGWSCWPPTAPTGCRQTVPVVPIDRPKGEIP